MIEDELDVYQTGAKRSKLVERYDLLSPIGLQRAAKAAAEGARKYGDFNNEGGLGVSVYLNHALAHIFAYLAGNRDEDHLGHLAWNALFACHSEEITPHLNEGKLRAEGCLPPKPKQSPST
jgi:hypothetical protein